MSSIEEQVAALCRKRAAEFDEIRAVALAWGGEFYSRELADHLRQHGWDCALYCAVPMVKNELRKMEAEGLLTSRLVPPGPDTYKGTMLRRYYRRKD